MYLDYSSTNVSQTLGLVRDKNKKSLKELLDTRGTPKMGDLSDKSPPGYNELKTSYVNEPGLYSLIFRSTKKQAQEFQDWVYEDVLTKLRQHGSYALSGSLQSSMTQSWVGGDLRLALNRRDDELKLALKQRDDDTKRVMVGMNEALKQRDDEVKLMLVGMLEAMQLRRDAELRERDAALQTLLAAHSERQADVVKQLETSLLAALAARMFCGTEEKPQTTN